MLVRLRSTGLPPICAAVAGIVICSRLAACSSTTEQTTGFAESATTTVMMTVTTTVPSRTTVTQALTVTETVTPAGRDSGAFAAGKVFDQQQLTQGVTNVLTGTPPNGYGLEVSNVKCPVDQPVVGGTAFRCTADIDGTPREIPVQIKDDNGLYEVSPPT